MLASLRFSTTPALPWPQLSRLRKQVPRLLSAQGSMALPGLLAQDSMAQPTDPIDGFLEELYVAKMAEIAGLPRTYENSH
mmetsp:Transcript_78108/g.135482  ORF Transcript_78108/g.135482 Transcript_78108/m.135482 type:complete len:80 (-) Transcript_78108:43-282(-)